METYYSGGIPDLGVAVVVVSTVAALRSSVDPLFQGAARELTLGDRLVVAVAWPGTPTDAPKLTTLGERLAYLARAERAHQQPITAVVVPVRPREPGEDLNDMVLRALSPVCQVRSVHAVSVTHNAISDVAAVPDAVDAGPVEVVREALARGAMAEVTAALGAYFPVTGLVVTGDQRGRVLGYPTANLQLDPRKLLPPNGVYAVRVRLPGEEHARHAAAASIGVRPTFGADLVRLVEVYLLDTSIDLYGEEIAVEFVDYLRPELRFDSVEALCEQMARDVERTREVLAAAPVS